MENFAMTYCMTTALERIQRLGRRVVVAQGGTSAGKTIAILLILLNYSIEHGGRVVTVMTDSYPNLRAGAMRDWLKICRQTRVLDVVKWNKAESTMVFPNGTLVEFKACDNMGALGARRDVLYVNEANRITLETFTSLEVRTREKIYLDYNPISEFWVHRELLGRDDVDFIKLTYLENEGLDSQIIKTIEDKRGDGTGNWWRVYGLGEVGSLEGNIYSGWQPVEKPEGAKLVRYGLDFGFSNDETALVGVYECDGGALWLDQLLYTRGMLGSQYPETLRSIDVDPSVLILADGARPEIIAEIKRAGFRCIAADKSAGSVLRGIDYVAQHQVTYNPESKDLEREFLTYAWRKKRSTGEILDEPEDGGDHLMDAIRYAVADLHKPRFDF